MKKLLTIVFCMITLLSYTQIKNRPIDSPIFKPKTDYVFAMNDVKVKSTLNTSHIDLRLPKYREVDNKSAGLVLFISGIAFTTASILESGDFTIYQGETARQIMLGVGIGLTISGGIVSLKD